jgi:hypothetical protein
MKTKILKATSGIMITFLLLFPVNRGNGQFLDILQMAMQWSHNVATIYTNAQTVQQIEEILQQIACAKYKYDSYREQLTLNSCLTKAQYKILDVQLSTVYTEIATTTMSVISSNGSNFGSGQLATVLNQIKAIAEKMKAFNDGVEAQQVVKKQEEGSVNFTAAALARSF